MSPSLNVIKTLCSCYACNGTAKYDEVRHSVIITLGATITDTSKTAH